MKFNPDKHHRKSIRLSGYDYLQTGAYFITICTQDKECFLGDVVNNQMILNQNGVIARNCWFELLKVFNNIRLSAFIAMPNHIHGIIIIQFQVKNHQTPNMDLVQHPDFILMRSPSLVLGKIIRHFKAKATISIRKNGAGHFQWQRNYYEEIIRNREELKQKCNYIINNPSNWKMDEENPKNIIPPSTQGTR